MLGGISPERLLLLTSLQIQILKVKKIMSTFADISICKEEIVCFHMTAKEQSEIVVLTNTTVL